MRSDGGSVPALAYFLSSTSVMCNGQTTMVVPSRVSSNGLYFFLDSLSVSLLAYLLSRGQAKMLTSFFRSHLL